jgi:hypothetical protein
VSVQHTSARQVIQADDWITKFQGTWVSTQGQTMFVQARYVSWVIFGVVFPVVLLVHYAFSGTVSLLPLTDLLVAVVVTYGIANLTNGEVTLAHAAVYASRWGRQASARGLARVRTPRPHRTRAQRDRLRVRLLPQTDAVPAPRSLVRRAPGHGAVSAIAPGGTGGWT